MGFEWICGLENDGLENNSQKLFFLSVSEWKASCQKKIIYRVDERIKRDILEYFL